MPVLSKDQIKKAVDWKVETVNVPEWGGDVCLRTLSGTERDVFEANLQDQKMKNFRCRFLVLCICDEAGERFYADDEVDELGKKSSVVINALFEKAWALNAFRTQDVEALGNDSPSAPSDASTSS